MPFEKHVLRQDLNIGTESVTECAQEIPASRRGSTLTPDPHYRECIPRGVKPLSAQSTRAWENCMARTAPAEHGLVCLTSQTNNRLEKIQSKDTGLWKVMVYTLSQQINTFFFFYTSGFIEGNENDILQKKKCCLGFVISYI